MVTVCPRCATLSNGNSRIQTSKYQGKEEHQCSILKISHHTAQMHLIYLAHSKIHLLIHIITFTFLVLVLINQGICLRKLELFFASRFFSPLTSTHVLGGVRGIFDPMVGQCTITAEGWPFQASVWRPKTDPGTVGGENASVALPSTQPHCQKCRVYLGAPSVFACPPPWPKKGTPRRKDAQGGS